MSAQKSRNGAIYRDELRRQAQTILYVDGLDPKKQHRTCWCARHALTEMGMPILRSPDGSGARIAKIKTCGSVWACPVCAAKVAELRRRELQKAMVKHKVKAKAKAKHKMAKVAPKAA